MIIPPAYVPRDERQWQRFFQECIVVPDQCKSYTVAELADVPTKIRLAIVTNETGGEVLAFRDSSDVWRRVTDRAVCS